MALQWDPGLSLGVAVIDQHHQELLDALNALVGAIAAGRGRDQVAKLLEFLGDYVVTHFSAEERLMVSTRYPDVASHKAEHEAFINELGRLSAEFRHTGPTAALAAKLNGTVSDWFREHIGGSDRKLAGHLNRSMARTG